MACFNFKKGMTLLFVCNSALFLAEVVKEPVKFYVSTKTKSSMQVSVMLLTSRSTRSHAAWHPVTMVMYSHTYSY